MIMIIVIEYSNTKPFRGPSETISYNYRVEFIKGTKSKITQRLFESYPHEVPALSCSPCPRPVCNRCSRNADVAS